MIWWKKLSFRRYIPPPSSLIANSKLNNEYENEYQIFSSSISRMIDIKKVVRKSTNKNWVKKNLQFLLSKEKKCNYFLSSFYQQLWYVIFIFTTDITFSPVSLKYSLNEKGQQKQVFSLLKYSVNEQRKEKIIMNTIYISDRCVFSLIFTDKSIDSR